MMVVYIFLIVFLCIILVKSADLAINNLNKIARFFNWNEFIVSFFLVAVATSLPEIFVSLASSINKVPSLSLGNIIGANIINLTLILGLVSILGKGVIINKQNRKKIFLTIGLMIFAFIFLIDAYVSRIEGVIILLSFILYFIFIFYTKNDLISKTVISKEKIKYKQFVYFILGLALLVIVASLITKIAEILALNFNFSLVLTGALVVSLGTTLPELTFGLRAALKGHKEMALGSSLGTIIANSCLAMGLAATIYPILIIDTRRMAWMLMFLLLSALALIIFSVSNQKISKKEGILLILFYLGFLVIQVFIIK